MALDVVVSKFDEAKKSLILVIQRNPMKAVEKPLKSGASKQRMNQIANNLQLTFVFSFSNKMSIQKFLNQTRRIHSVESSAWNNIVNTSI